MKWVKITSKRGEKCVKPSLSAMFDAFFTSIVFVVCYILRFSPPFLRFTLYFLYSDGDIPVDCLKQRLKYFGSLKPDS